MARADLCGWMSIGLPSYTCTALTVLGVALYLSSGTSLSSPPIVERGDSPLELRTEPRGGYLIHHVSFKSARNWKRSNLSPTLATQLSTNNLHFVPGLVESWDAPVSAALFCANHELEEALYAVIHLVLCFPAVRERVQFHVTTTSPSRFTGKAVLDILTSGSNLPEDGSSVACDRLLEHLLDQFPRDNYDLGPDTPYPTNAMRNVARRGVRTEYVLTVDVDLVPSTRLVEETTAALESLQREGRLTSRTALVVPVFEIAESRPIPTNKPELVSAVGCSYVRPYHVIDYPKAQGPTRSLAWLSSERKDLENTPGIFGVAEYEAEYEPFLVTRSDAPLFPERFVQYGYDRSSQVCELFVAGYTFLILDQGFLVHRGFKGERSLNIRRQNYMNEPVYRAFLFDLYRRYPDSGRSCTDVRNASTSEPGGEK